MGLGASRRTRAITDIDSRAQHTPLREPRALTSLGKIPRYGGDSMRMNGAHRFDVGFQLRPMRLEADAEAVSELIFEYLTWGAVRLKEEYNVDDAPTDVRSVSESLRAFTPPGALMIVAEADDGLLGIAALRTLAPGVAEVKRMYVAPRARGLHLGSALLDAVLWEAREVLRVATVRLDTCRFMTDAQRLYQSRGFVECPPYAGSEIPADLQQYWRFFELDLEAQ
jgi:GNAT superfamily N-acetyltransferase